MNQKIIPIIILALSVLLFNGCGGESTDQPSGDSSSAQTNEQGLTEFELEHGLIPKSLKQYHKKLFGLTIAPERLRQIRKERRSLGSYSSIKQISFEVRESERMFEKNNINLISLDAAIKDADIIVILVGHFEFKSIDKKFLENKVIIDTLGILN